MGKFRPRTRHQTQGWIHDNPGWGKHPIYSSNQSSNTRTALAVRRRGRPPGEPRLDLANIMKRKLKGLSQQYHAAVCKHVQQGPRASLLPAHDLGCQAAALELETLDVARIHEAAVAVLKMQVAEQFKKTESPPITWGIWCFNRKMKKALM